MFKMLGSGGGTSIKQKLQLKEHQVCKTIIVN